MVVGDLQFHKTSDSTVAVSKGMDFNVATINIPSSISIDGVRFSVTAIADNAFKNTVKDDTKIIIPSSVQYVGNYCFYNLVNVEYIDLSALPCTGSGYGYGYNVIPTNGSIAWYELSVNPNSKLDRIKVPGYWYATPACFYGGWAQSIRYGTSGFNLVMFYDENDAALSYWVIKSSVRLNELQDPNVKEGYTFAGWKENTYYTSGSY